jgi:hypothetical protein
MRSSSIERTLASASSNRPRSFSTSALRLVRARQEADLELRDLLARIGGSPPLARNVTYSGTPSA